MAEICSAADAAAATFQMILEWFSGKKEVLFSTGFDRLDSIVYGFQPGKVVLLASRPSAGKTAYALNIVRNMIHKSPDKRLLYCSYDLDRIQLMLRFFCVECGFDVLGPIERWNDQSPRQMMSEAERFDKFQLWLDSSCGVSIDETERKIRGFLKEQPLDLIIIDSLEMLKYQYSSAAVKTIRKIAGEFQLSVLLLTTCYGEGVHCRIQDLDFGIADNCDTVMFLERERKPGTENEKVPAKLIVAGNTCGLTGAIPMEYDGKTMVFTEKDPNEDEE